MARAKERQNQVQIDWFRKNGPVKLGIWNSYCWRTDPRLIVFMLSRYKFCAKMLADKKRVLEVGCGDAFGMNIVLQTVGSVHGVDFEPAVIEAARRRIKEEEQERFSLEVLDVTRKPAARKFDAAYSLDVIEHIPRSKEKIFMKNICASLKKEGVLIIGTPNLDASRHASPLSKIGHVNLKNAAGLRKLMGKYFQNVFNFSMNDEVVHTGFSPMAHYLFAMGVGKKGAA